MSEQGVPKSRIYLVYIAMLVFAALIVGRIFTIQVVEGEYWRDRAEKVTTKYRNVNPDRGHIYSDDGRLLATSVPKYELRMDLRADGLSDELFQSGIDSLCYLLAETFNNGFKHDKSPAEYKRMLLDARQRGDRYKRIRTKVKHDQLMAARDFPIWREGRFKGGLIVEKSTQRTLPFDRLAKRTVGYFRNDDTSAVGLELAFNVPLRGSVGKRLERRLTGGVWMPVDDEMSVRPEDGHNVHTTLDVNLQDVADAALERQLRKHDASHGSVVVMEVATGYVKAIANLKKVVTKEEQTVYVENYNYAIGAATEPGSTFKLPALMVALEDKLVDLQDSVDTEDGTTKFYDRTMRDSHKGGYGRITLKRAFEVSSNVAISKVINEAYKSDPMKFVQGLEALGISDRLGISIPGEGRPVLTRPGDDGWSGVALPWLSIGYGVQLAPIQTLALYNAVANNGKLMRPQFVKSIARTNNEVESFPPLVLKEKICSDRTLESVREMLEAVVDTGTAMNLRGAHFKIAGKTGTAQIASQGGTGYKAYGLTHQASFVGYFPASAPKYSCIVVVNAPSRSVYYGNLVAGPIFREIADKIYSNRLELQHEVAQRREPGPQTPVSFSGNRHDLATVMDELNIPVAGESESDWVTTEARDSTVMLFSRSVPSAQSGVVPKVIGLGLKDALYILENNGLQVTVRGHGMVKRQSLKAGTHFRKGNQITIELS